jgi:hypothetical protein
MILGANVPKKTDAEIVTDWEAKYSALKDAKNISQLKEIRGAANWLGNCTFDSAPVIKARFDTLLAEKTAEVKARYESNGWAFNF